MNNFGFDNEEKSTNTTCGFSDPLDELFEGIKRNAKILNEGNLLAKAFYNFGKLYFYVLNKDSITEKDLEIIDIDIKNKIDINDKICEESENIKEIIARINELLPKKKDN